MKITLIEVKGSKKFNKKKGKNVCRTTSTLYITPTQKPSLQKACAKINFLETIQLFPCTKRQRMAITLDGIQPEGI